MPEIKERHHYQGVKKVQGVKTYQEVQTYQETNIHSKGNGKKSNSYQAFKTILPKISVALAGTGVIAGGVIATSSGFMNGPTIRLSNAVIYNYGQKDGACFLTFSLYIDNLKNDYLVRIRCDSWVYSMPIYEALGFTDSSDFTTAGIYEGTISYSSLPKNDNGEVFVDVGYYLSFVSKSKGTTFFGEHIFLAAKNDVPLASKGFDMSYYSAYKADKLFVFSFTTDYSVIESKETHYENIYVQITDYLGYSLPPEHICDDSSTLYSVLEYSLDDPDFAYKYKQFVTLEVYELDGSEKNTLFIANDIRL